VRATSLEVSRGQHEHSPEEREDKSNRAEPRRGEGARTGGYASGRTALSKRGYYIGVNYNVDDHRHANEGNRACYHPGSACRS
jgi:hypothetical protein